MKSISKDEIREIYNLPLITLIHRASEVHRMHHCPEEVQISTLVSIKTGGCPEDCAYCPQAARYHTKVNVDEMLSVDDVVKAAEEAKELGSSRLCMGAAWRNVKNNKDFDRVLDMVKTVNSMEMEVCCTLGMITENQAKRLAAAGLYAYNHNIDTSEEYYKEIISTRSYDDRLKTIDNARNAGITICSGGIIGMGESAEDRIDMLFTLSLLNPLPESVPINALVPVEGTPLENQTTVSSWEMIRMIATARLVLPKTQIRLSAGRKQMNHEAQALCFLAGANSIFSGEKLLTTPNPELNEDKILLDALGLKPKKPFEDHKKPEVYDLDLSELNDEEIIRWSRPKHKIEKNIMASQKK